MTSTSSGRHDSYVSWVLFDYGLVICDPPTPQDEDALADAVQVPRSVFLEQYWKWRLSYDRADLDAGRYWQAVGSGLGLSLDDAAIAKLIRLDCESWLHVRPDMTALVAELSAAGHQVGLLSNAPAEVAGAIRVLPVAGLFQRMCFSWELRATKPDPACFLRCLDQLGAAPDSVAFLDDRPENVAAAATLGMRSVRYTDPAQARADLLRLVSVGA
jgi:putative hydrolase of the HAD superfamily